MQELYLGVDGGQSHTAAVVADADGHVLGRGHGGPSNHAEQPGGRERLRRAVEESVAVALAKIDDCSIQNTKFAAAHCAMTGAGDYKLEIISDVIRAQQLTVGHDAPAALAGATGGQPGVVVIAGTGSVAYGEDAAGTKVRTGGWGFLFGDEGSGFWTAAEGVRRAMKAQDRMTAASVLGEAALDYFAVPNLDTLAAAFYYEKISRDRLASFAETVRRTADEGDAVARAILTEGGAHLARLGASVAHRLDFADSEMRLAAVGGMFRSELVRESFAAALKEQLPQAVIVAPRFDPAIGALLLAYLNAGRDLSSSLLSNLSARAN